MVNIKGGRKRLATGLVSTVTVGLALGAFALSGTASGATRPADATAAAGAAKAAGHAKPTIVLEHGAFADGSSWNGVDRRPARRRLPGQSPPPTRCAARPPTPPHCARSSTTSRARRSSSATPTAATSSARPPRDDSEVKGLVYVAAFLPAPGESALELTNKYPGSTLPDALDPVTYHQADGSTATDLYIQQDKFRHQFAADVPAGQAALMAAEQRPIAQSALEEKATSAAWKTIPSWDIVTTRDLNIPPAVQRFMAQRAHAHTTEVGRLALGRGLPPAPRGRRDRAGRSRHRPLNRRRGRRGPAPPPSPCSTDLTPHT